MISKDQLARFVRYLNQNYLSNNKIRYFSTKRKKQILKELEEIYSIQATDTLVHETKVFLIRNIWLTPNDGLLAENGLVFLEANRTFLQSSSRRVHSLFNSLPSLLVTSTAFPPVTTMRRLLPSFKPDQTTFSSAVITFTIFPDNFLSSSRHLLRK